MRWEVQGAEAATGKEVTISVEAATAEEAEQQARYNGLLVSRVYKPTGKPLGYRGPVETPKAINYAPEYRDILNSGKTLRVVASILRILAGVAVVAAVLSAGNAAAPIGMGVVNFTTIGLPLLVLLAGLVPAAILFGAAALLTAVAGIGGAVRNIARNSYRQ